MRSSWPVTFLTGNHVYKIGFDQISPSASPIRDLGKRLIIYIMLSYRPVCFFPKRRIVRRGLRVGVVSLSLSYFVILSLVMFLNVL